MTTTDIDDFFKTHGVGDYGVEEESREIAPFISKEDATPKERQFCRHMANGRPAGISYGAVYDPDGKYSADYHRAAASRLLKRPRVAKYYLKVVEEREALAAEELPNLVKELNEDRHLARQLGQAAAAISAVKAKANLLGLENNSPRSVTVNLGITEEQREAILKRIASREIPTQTSSPDTVLDAEYTDVTNND